MEYQATLINRSTNDTILVRISTSEAKRGEAENVGDGIALIKYLTSPMSSLHDESITHSGNESDTVREAIDRLMAVHIGFELHKIEPDLPPA